MKQRKFTSGITFFTTPQMYEALKGVSDAKDLGISELLRNLIEEYLTSCPESGWMTKSHEDSLIKTPKPMI